MAWRIVLQPNKKLGLFSDVVDNFIHMNMSRNDAIHVCMSEYNMSAEETEVKLRNGLKDVKPFSIKPGSGTDRWDDAIETIEICHGKQEAERILKLGNQ